MPVAKRHSLAVVIPSVKQIVRLVAQTYGLDGSPGRILPNESPSPSHACLSCENAVIVGDQPVFPRRRFCDRHHVATISLGPCPVYLPGCRHGG